MSVDDPQAAIGCMVFTATHADMLKQQAGVATTGRKRQRGTVFTYSLSWAPEEEPDRVMMVKAADETIAILGLQNHEALIISHNDTAHPHIHVLCNLINPSDGLMYDPDWGSRLKLSEWALKHELENGKIHCPQRVQNSEERKNGQQVRYEEPRHHLKEKIQEIYAQSKDGQSFIAALEENGYTLTTGNRRRFVLVDDYGKIYSLSRQLDEEQRKSHLQKLADLDHASLPIAQMVAEQRMYFDRDGYEAEQQQKIEDAAISHERQRLQADMKEKRSMRSETPLLSEQGADNSTTKEEPQKMTSTNLKTSNEGRNSAAEPFYEQYDRMKAASDKADKERFDFENRMKEFYKLDEQKKKLEDLELQREKLKFYQKLAGKEKELSSMIDAQKKSMADAANRIKEAREAMGKKLEDHKVVGPPQTFSNENDPKKSPVVDFEKVKQFKEKEQGEADKKRAKDAFKEKERSHRDKEREERDRSLDMDFGKD